MSNGPWGSGGGSGGPWGGRPSGSGSGGNRQDPPFRPKGPGKDQFEEKLAQMQESLRRNLNLENRPGRAIGLALLVLGALWLGSGFYKVDSKEVGIVQRFGRFVGRTAPGLRYHLPYPIERVTLLGVLNINTVEVGFRGEGGYRNAEGGIKREKLMLTGDQNIVEIEFDVQWKIDETHPEWFLFNVRDAQNTIQPVAESAMREAVGIRQITDILAKQEEKLKIETEVRSLIQAALDTYKAGIRIEKVNLLKADPPPAVIDAFRDVKTAEQEKETTQNKAWAYANQVVPQARGEAERILREAEGYKQAVLAEAQGNAGRFEVLAAQYRNAPDVTAKRLYLETMEDVLKDIPKVIVDTHNGGPVTYLPLPAPAAPKPSANDSAEGDNQ